MEPQTVLQTRVIILAAILSCVMTPRIFAQQAPETQVGSGRPATFADLLRAHNIGLTEAALLRALKNANSEVRSLAAMKLEEDKAIDAIPAIKDALAAESVPRARVNIALALGLFGDPVGYDELKKVCADKDFIPEFRLYAVRYTFDLHSQNDACLRAAKEIVESKGSSFGDRISAIDLLPQFQNLTTEETGEILKIVFTCLDDPEPVVRMAASHALVSLGDASAVPILQSAIAREQDENIRSVYEMDLKKLQRKEID
jgi:HEAT repeat protein